MKKKTMVVLIVVGLFIAACGSDPGLATAAATEVPSGVPSPPPTSVTEVEPTPDSQSEPTGDADMVRGPVYLDMVELQVRESEPVQLALHLQGNLPTPCHQLKYQISGADDEGNIRVEAWSEAPADQECIQVLQALDETIELGIAREGAVTVLLNGEKVGTVDLEP